MVGGPSGVGPTSRIDGPQEVIDQAKRRRPIAEPGPDGPLAHLPEVGRVEAVRVGSKKYSCNDLVGVVGLPCCYGVRTSHSRVGASALVRVRVAQASDLTVN